MTTTCPNPNKNGLCGCPGHCAECGMKPHAVSHQGAEKYSHEFVSVNPKQKDGGK